MMSLHLATPPRVLARKPAHTWLRWEFSTKGRLVVHGTCNVCVCTRACACVRACVSLHSSSPIYHSPACPTHTQYTQNSYSLSDANTALTSALLHAVGGGGSVGMSQEGNGLGHVSR